MVSEAGVIEKRVEDLYGYALTIARNYYKKGNSRVIGVEDVESAALFGLFDAARKYNSEKGPFKNYAAVRIRGAVKDLFRSRICDYSRVSEDVAVRWLSMHSENDEGEDSFNAFMDSIVSLPDPVAGLINREHAQYCIDALPETYREVVEMYLEGMSMQAISDAKGKSQPWSSYILRRAREKMQETWWGLESGK